MINERVEAIRRQHAVKDVAGRCEECRTSDCDAAYLLTALAQAEHDVQTWKDMGEKEHALAVQFAKEKEQAERERDDERALSETDQRNLELYAAEVADLKRDLVAARAEVERLWAKVAAIIRWPNDGPVPTEDNILPALTGLLASIPAYQAEVKRWKERVTTLETEEKWEALKQAEAALARVRAALEQAISVVERHVPGYAGALSEWRAALEGRG